MYFVKRGSSDSNLPKIDTTAAVGFQPMHAMVCTERLLVFVLFNSLLFVAQPS